MRPSVSLAILALSLIVAAAPALAGTLHERTVVAGPGPESRARQYQVYVPDARPDNAPLVTVLHGCLQTEDDMIKETRFTELADQHGFVVVFPFITSWDQSPFEFRFTNCWGFWFPEERTEGSGEVADIRRIISEVESEFGTDPSRRYVAGLSAGAAMAVDLAVAYSEDIAAAGAVAGLPYAEAATAVTTFCGQPPVPHDVEHAVEAMVEEQAEPEEQRLVPLMVVHSVGDCTVSILNGQNLRDSWLEYYGADGEPETTEDCSADGVACSLERFVNPAGATVVETVFYDGETTGDTHYWPGDGSGEFANPDGPSASEHLWRFFADKSLAREPAVELTADVTVEGNMVRLNGTASAEGGLSALFVGLDGAEPQGEVRVEVASDGPSDGHWSTEFPSVATDQFYVPVMRAALADGRVVTRTGERFAVGRPVEIVEEFGSWLQHQAAGRIGFPAQRCSNRLWGVCDRDFTSLLLEHQFVPFALYRRADGDEWYADAENAVEG